MKAQEIWPVLQPMGWALFHFLWQGALIALFLMIVLRCLRGCSANARYVTGCGALLLMAMAPIATVEHLIRAERDAVVSMSNVVSIPSTETLNEASTRLDAARPVAYRAAGAEQSLVSEFEAALPWLVLGWFGIVVLLSFRLLAGWFQLCRLQRTATQLGGEFWDQARARIAHELNVSRPIRLLKSAWLEVPTVIGWLRPVIVFPASSLVGLTPEQLETILAHEVAHIRRHDYLVNILQSLVETLLFYHPGVWWVSAQIRQEREHCCDDLAVRVCGNRLDYARALATLEELRAAPVLWELAAGGGSLLTRIQRLAGRPPTPNRSGWWTVAVVSGIVLLLGTSCMLHSSISAAERKVNTTTDKPQFNPRLAATAAGSQTEKSSSADANSRPSTATLVQDGRLLIEQEKLDEAETKFQEVLKLDPEHEGAQYYLGFIRERKLLSQPERQLLRETEEAGRSTVSLAPSSNLRTNLVRAGKGRERIRQKLASIEIEEVLYEDMRLSEVIRHLGNEALRRDPDRRGVNFIVLPTDSSKTADLDHAVIRVSPALRNVRLADIIDAVCKRANVPLTYTVEDDAVVFSPPAPVGLFTRRYKVDPNTFVKNLESALPKFLGLLPEDQPLPTVREQVRYFFKAAGVDLPVPSASSEQPLENRPEPGTVFPAGKALFYNDRAGIILARATLAELDIMEEAIQALNAAPPQVVIEARFAELSAADAQALGLEWFLSSTNAAGPQTVATITGLQTDPHFREWLSNATHVVGSVAGILTETQYNALVKKLKGRSGVDLLSAPKVTTLSGRQAFVDVTQLKNVVRRRVSPTNADGTDADARLQEQFETAKVRVGSAIDVTPYVSADGGSIQLALTAQLVEFVGYADPATASEPNGANRAASGDPLPRFRNRQTTTKMVVPDGQTLVLAGMPAEDPLPGATKMPKHLIIFVTPAVIDAAGNRVRQ